MSAGPLLFVGQTVLDHVFRVERFSAEGGKAVAGQQSSRIGGMAARAALAVQHLRQPDRSPRVRLFSAVGDDAAGRQLQAALRAEGLDVEVVPGARSGVSAVLVDARGERQVTNFRGDALQRSPLRELPQACCGVLVDTRWPEAAPRALEHARTLGVPGLLDADVAAPEVLRALVPLAGWCVFSRVGLAAWSGDPVLAPADALARVAHDAPGAELVVTLGAEGALWRRPDGCVHVLPAFRVDAVDTNGAGDVMHGALLLALAEAQPPERALRWAMAAAALACRGETPTRSALDGFLETQP